MSGPERSTETFERSGPERPDGFFERSGFAGAAWDGDACAVASKDRGETTCACGDVDEPGDYAALSNEEIYADYVERFFADPLDPDLAKQNALIRELGRETRAKWDFRHAGAAGLRGRDTSIRPYLWTEFDAATKRLQRA